MERNGTHEGSGSTSREEGGEEGDGGGPTINFGDFLSLLAPLNVSTCLTCRNPLVSSNPPSLFPQKKDQVLKSFCDILNLPFAFGEDKEKGDKEEEEEEEGLEFPFCFQCTKDKVLMLTELHERLRIIEEQFAKLREVVLKDIMRGFVTSVVIERNIPVEALRKTRICEQMFQMFKRHAERKKPMNMMESEAQTEIASVLTPLMTPAAVASLLESGAGSNGITNTNRRRKVQQKKEESQQNTPVSLKRGPSTNLNSLSVYTSPRMSPLKRRAGMFDSCNGSPVRNNAQSTVMEESIVSFDEQMVTGMFAFDEDGGFSLGERGNIDTTKGEYSNHCNINGYSTIDEEFQNALGLTDGYDVPAHPSSVAQRVYAPLTTIPKSSPVTYMDLDSAQKLRRRPDQDGGSNKYASHDVGGKKGRKAAINFQVEQDYEDEKAYECRGCDKRFARRDALISHEEHHVVNSRRNYFCHRCMRKVKLVQGKSAYINHCVDTHRVEDDVVEFFYFCDIDECSESYKIKEDFVNHLKSHWQLGVSLVCGQCDKTFACQRHLNTHMENAHRDRVVYFDCQFCYRGFEDENDFAQHLLFHKVKIPEELSYPCDVCDKIFETIGILRRHKYRAHGTSKSLVAGDELLTNNEVASLASNTEFVCEDCGKAYRSKNKLRKHAKKHLEKGHRKRKSKDSESDSEDDMPSAGDIDDDEDDQDYGCPVLVPAPAAKRKGQRKASIHDSDKRCPFCSQTFKKDVELRRHCVNFHRSMHMSKAQVHCVVCFLVFNNQQELEVHYDDTHSKLRCHICRKVLQTTSLLRQHVDDRHQVHPHVCPLCQCGFKLEAKLKMHMTREHKNKKSREQLTVPPSISEEHDTNGQNNNASMQQPDNVWNFNFEQSYDSNMMDFF